MKSPDQTRRSISVTVENVRNNPPAPVVFPFQYLASVFQFPGKLRPGKGSLIPGRLRDAISAKTVEQGFIIHQPTIRND